MKQPTRMPSAPLANRDRAPATAQSGKVQATPALLALISTREEAEAFMRELVRLGLDYHFDDGAVDCLYGNGRVTKQTAVVIDAQVSRCYAAWEASGVDMQHDCPIGYLLDYGRYEEALGAAVQMMEAAEGLEPTSALKQAASDCDISEGLPMSSFVKWAFNKLLEQA